MPNNTATITQNQIQSRIKPFTSNHVERYKQNGLKPIILEGSDKTRFPKMINNSFTECSQLGLSENWMPSLSLMSGPHIVEFRTDFFGKPIHFPVPLPLFAFGAVAQPPISR
jgi:hypothetical protein